MKKMKLAAVLTLAAVSVVLGGCRAEEQGRILSYQKGVYLGKPDSEPDAALRRVLRQRVQYQRGLDVIGGGGAGPVPGPGLQVGIAASSGSGGLPLDVLRRRGERQRFN